MWRCFGHYLFICPRIPCGLTGPPKQLSTLPHLTGTSSHHQNPFKVAYHPTTPSRWPQPAPEHFLNILVTGVQPSMLKLRQELQADLVASPIGGLSCSPVCYSSSHQACSQLYQGLTPNPKGSTTVAARSLRERNQGPAPITSAQ